MRKLKIGLGLLIAAVMLVGMVGVGWGVPNLINVQGRLVDKATGLAVADQTLDVTVNYYTTITGGTPIAAISGTAYSPRTDSNGVFNLTLGEGLPEALKPDFTAEDYYVEFVVGATIGGTWRMETIPDPTLPSPANKRQRLVAVPFAITAKNVRGGTVVADGRNWVSVYGTNTFTTDNNIKSAYVENPAGSGTFLPVGAIAGKAEAGYTGVSGLSNKGFGVYGSTLRTEDQNAAGVGGLNPSSGPGVWGANMAVASTTGNRDGVYGTSVNGAGVRGISLGTATSADPSLGAGVVGKNAQTTVPSGRIAAPGVYGESTVGIGIMGRVTNTLNFEPAVKGTSLYGHGTYGPAGYGAGVFGENTATTAGGPGVRGESQSGDGIRGLTRASGVGAAAGVHGLNQAASNGGPGVFGSSLSGTGVNGTSSSGIGVSGSSGSTTLAGVKAVNTANGPALEIGSGTIKIASNTSTFTFWPGVSETMGMDLGGGLGRFDVALTKTKRILTELLNTKAGTIYYPADLSSSTTSVYNHAVIYVQSNVITNNSQIFISTNVDDCRVLKVDATNRVIILFLSGRAREAGGIDYGHRGYTVGRIDFLIIN